MQFPTATIHIVSDQDTVQEGQRFADAAIKALHNNMIDEIIIDFSQDETISPTVFNGLFYSFKCQFNLLSELLDNVSHFVCLVSQKDMVLTALEFNFGITAAEKHNFADNKLKVIYHFDSEADAAAKKILGDI